MSRCGVQMSHPAKFFELFSPKTAPRPKSSPMYARACVCAFLICIEKRNGRIEKRGGQFGRRNGQFTKRNGQFGKRNGQFEGRREILSRKKGIFEPQGRGF